VAALVERVAPLFAQIQKRVIPTDQEVKQANLGEYESIILEMVRYSREIEGALQSYQQSIQSVAPLLTPQLLGTDSGRFVLSSKIKQFEAALRQLEQVVGSSTNNYKERSLTLGEKFSPQGRAVMNQGFMRGALLQQEQFRIFFENQNSVLTNFQNIAEVVTKFKPTPGSGTRDDLVRFVNPYAAILFREYVQKGFALAQREQEIASGIESSTAEAVRRFQGVRSAPAGFGNYPGELRHDFIDDFVGQDTCHDC
jgi:exonuclease VII small subunit